MLVANAVVDTDQPRLQVGENQMDDRQVLLGNLSYCQKLCMGLSCGGAILAFSIHEFDASNDLGELI